MSAQPIVPNTTAEQIDALKRMAPELVTKRNRLPEPHTVQALLAMARSVEQVAAEEGVPLRIVEVRSVPSPNPLAAPLAHERVQRRMLLWNVERGLLASFVLMAMTAVLVSQGWVRAASVVLLFQTLAYLPLLMLCRAAKAEVR